MKKPNITPGEWAACSGLAGERFNIETRGVGNDCFPISTLKGPDRKANAQAVAAVPELLEALERCIHAWDGSETDDLHAVAAELTHGDMKAIKHALTKAGYTF